MGKNFSKFRLLLWKNGILQCRRKCQIVFYVVFTLICLIILWVMRAFMVRNFRNEVTYNPFCTTPITTSVVEKICDKDSKDKDNTNVLTDYSTFSLIYSPRNNDLDNAMKGFSGIFAEVIPLENSKELVNYYQRKPANVTFAGIEFDDSYAGVKDMSKIKNIKVSIRFPGELRMDQGDWKSNLINPLLQEYGPREYSRSTGATPSYYGEGFLTVQHLLTLFLILAVSQRTKVDNVADLLSKNQPPTVSMRRFPHASWTEDIFLVLLSKSLPILIVIIYCIPATHLIKSLAIEKENQLKEIMKIMGLSSWLHWTAWFVKSFLLFFVLTIIVTLGLTLKLCHGGTVGVISNAQGSLVFVFFLIYSCALITFCFALSSFFSKSNNATVVTFIVFYVSFMPYGLTQNQSSLTKKLFSCLIANSALCGGVKEIIMHETAGGVRWSTMFTPNSYDSPLSLGLVCVMLLLDTFFHILICLYMEAVRPGHFGVPKPWNFLCKRSYWRRGSPDETQLEGATSSANQGEFFEAEPRNLRTGIAIKDLGKTFKKKVAIQNLTLNMFEGQITVLLGHNGAGKTTTMSILTGMIPPSSGTATVNGHDIRTEIVEARSSVGLCPQNNVLFDSLTVTEHFYFFGKLKGLSRAQVYIEINKYIRLLNLQAKRNARASTLSGGMKRKLCVGIALCGNSKIVMLDEPTSGMDPTARRGLWDLLLKEKEGRSILLTTHMMEEADLLGDRIAILADGKLQCCGSGFFLKKKYGAGYSLILEKSRNCDVAQVTQLLQRHIPEVKIQSNVGTELSYVLPENQSTRFEPMLKDLENNLTKLGVLGYGISLSTMEQVFLKVGAERVMETKESKLPDKIEKNRAKDGNRGIATETYSSYTGGPKLVGNQLRAMFTKKWLATRRSWLRFLFNLLIPLLLLILFLVTLKLTKFGSMPPRVLDLAWFHKPVTMVETTTDTVYADKYSDVLSDLSYNSERSSNIKERMLRLSAERPGQMRRSYIVGASFAGSADTPHITAWFNNDPYHSPGISLGLVLNAIYRQMVKCSDCSIQFTNHPLPFTAKSQVSRMRAGQSASAPILGVITYCMIFIPTILILFVTKENASNSKHLQFVSGAKLLVFWLTAALYDMLTYLTSVLLIVITIACFQVDGLSSAGDLGRLSFILFCFGWAIIPFIYLIALIFKIPASAYGFAAIVFLITGLVAELLCAFLRVSAKKAADVVELVLLVFPHFCLQRAFKESSRFHTFKSLCSKCVNDVCNSSSPLYDTICKGVDESYYKWNEPGIGKHVCIFLTFGLLLFLILLSIDGKLFSIIIYRLSGTRLHRRSRYIVDEDPDVAEEKQKIRNANTQDLTRNYALVLCDLTKYYGGATRRLLAVNGLCLGVQKNECFGLLGVNGAGKTTTFKMMTGDLRITRGDGWVQGFSMKKQMNQVQKCIGYCPQFDALLDHMTCKETIVMVALLRGIRYSDCARLAETLATEFDFLPHFNKKVKELSGGTKRKLSTAISIIGDPPVIYLDEPTTGMDPVSKRHLWNNLCKIRDSGKCLILTTHSMEESEALCTRLAIMVNGNFKCLGSTQHLKNKFARNYALVIKLKKPEAGKVTETSTIENFIKKQFPGANLKEKHEEMLSYYITDLSMPWSQMFGILEKAKQADYNIEDYSLGQSSLEQVFLTFTKQQR